MQWMRRLSEILAAATVIGMAVYFYLHFTHASRLATHRTFLVNMSCFIGSIVFGALSKQLSKRQDQRIEHVR